MNTNTKQEVLNLLPWYHLGKLTDEEAALVESALHEDPSLQEDSLLDQQIMHKVQADKTLLDGSVFDSSADRLSDVLSKIDQLEQVAPTHSAKPASTPVPKPSLLVRAKTYLDGLLSGNSHSFTYAVFAALTVVQLALLVLFIVPSDNIQPGTSNQGFELASYLDEEPNQPLNTAPGQMVLLVGMQSHFKVEGFDKILGKVEVEVLPDADGYYRISLNKKLTPSEIEELKHELSKKHGTIVFIGEEATSF